MKIKNILPLAASTALITSASAAIIAMDDFSGYTAAPTSLGGQAGVPVPIGFTGTWVTGVSTAVVNGVLTTGAGTTGRTYRAFDTSVTSNTSTISISFIATLPSSFSGIELQSEANRDSNSIRICTNSGNIVIQGKGSDGSEQNYFLRAIDTVPHIYSLDLNSTTQSGRARVDSGSWVPFAFTNIGGFAMNALCVADYSGYSLTLDNFSISTAASAVPEPSTHLVLLAIGTLSLMKRRRGKTA